MIVEDGTNVSNSNSYVSVEYADQYFSTFNNTDWNGTDDDKMYALIQATQAIDLLYGQQYASFPMYSDQSLLFPRMSMVINYIQIIAQNTIPRQLKNAVCEVALMVLQGEDVFPTANTEAQVQSKTDTIGDLTQTRTYKSAPTVERYVGFNKVELLLKPILVDPTTSTWSVGL